MSPYGPEFQLRWPRGVFVSEAIAIASLPSPSNQAEWLLEEAFAGIEPQQELAKRSSLISVETAGDYLRELARDVDQFPTDSKQYWNTRRSPNRTPEPLTRAEVRAEWIRRTADLQRTGYFARVAPRECVDGEQREDPDRVIAGEILKRAHVRTGWPLTIEGTLPADEFYTIVEVVHDLIARPRSRFEHTYDNCGWHYSDHSATTGQALYRAMVNDLFERGQLDVRFAESGEDLGRLVTTTMDGRADLMNRAVERSVARKNQYADDGQEVQHAIAQFRDRAATRVDKRNACVTLAGVLERRRNLIKAELLSKDEGALFQIANQFAIRHQRADQKNDYADDYLDWIFWFYLATIELTDRIGESRSGSTGA